MIITQSICSLLYIGWNPNRQSTSAGRIHPKSTKVENKMLTATILMTRKQTNRKKEGNRARNLTLLEDISVEEQP
jgi:hypothetical protein